MPSGVATSPRWKALPRMGYGIVVYPFRPLSDTQFMPSLGANGRPTSKRDPAYSTFNLGRGTEIAAQQLSLDLGDEVYVFEQADGWYRGYVVTSVTPPVTLSTSSSSSSHGPTMKIATEVKGLMEPKVYVGIFPANYVSVKEYVSDALGVLTNADEDDEDYYSGNASERSSYVSQSSTKPRLEYASPSNSQLKPSPTSPSFGRPSSYRDTLQKPRRKSNSSRKPDKGALSKPAKSGAGPGQRPPPLPALKVGDDTEAGFDEPLVDEISAALREWHGLLFGIFLSKKYTLFRELSTVILKLERARRDLLSGLLTKSETIQLRREIVAMLNVGNKMIPGGAVIIRDPESEDRGQIVDGEGSISPIALMAMQANVATTTPSLDSIGAMSNSTSPGKTIFSAEVVRPQPVLSHLLVNMRAFVGSICSSAHEGVELMFALYARHEHHFLSEFFLVKLNHNGVPAGPRPEDLVGRIQTLFTDLTSRDVAEEVYLVCRIFKTGEAKDVLRPGTANGTTSVPKEQSRASVLFDMARPSSSGSNRLQKSSSSIIRPKGSRVSQIFSRSTSPEGTNPALKNAHSVGSFSSVKANGAPKAPSYRKPFGCAVLDLSKILQEHPSSTSSLSESGTDHVMPIFVAFQDYDFHQLHERIIESKTNKFTKQPRADSINVNIKVFHGDRVDEVVQAHPTVLLAVPRTNRVGFNDAPFQSRSDIFITVEKATNTASLLKSNALGFVMVSAEVRLNDRLDTIIENCVFRGTGTEDGRSTYESYTVGNHHDVLSWDEKFKICISEDIAPRALLVFKFNMVRSSTHHPENNVADPDPPTAVAALNLSNDGFFARDGQHRLKIRRLEGVSTFEQQLATYLLDETAAPVISDPSLLVDTFLCSTRITEDNTLHSLLHWKQDIGTLASDESRFKMKEILRKFTFVSEIEILKFLSEVFDALFGILVEVGTRGELDDYVYRAIVYILSMEADRLIPAFTSDNRRFSNFKAKLEEYTRKRFNFPFITKSMLRAAKRLLTNTSDPHASKRLRATMKVWRPLARFLVRARQQQRAKEVKLGINTDHTESTFKEDIMSLVKLLQQIMHPSQPAPIVGTQTLALQHFSALLPELSPVFSPEELLEIAVGFVDSCLEPKGKMALYKLQLISNLVRSPVFTANPSLERLLVFNIPRWLKPHCGKAPEFTGISTVEADYVKVLWREQVRLCTAVVAFSLDYLWAFISGDEGDEDARSRGAEGFALLQPLMSDLQQSYLWVKELGNFGNPRGIISPLFPATYPFPTKPIIGGDKAFETLDELLAELSGVLMTSAIRAEYCKVAGLFGFRPTTNALSPLLVQSFQVYTSILSSEAFPSLWLNSHILVHKAIINHLVTISEAMIQFYNPDPEQAESFDTPLWLAFFNLLLKTVGSEALAVEHLPPQQRRAVWRIAGDLRRRGADLLRHSWAAIGWPTSEQETKGFQIDRMGGYQVQYVPSLVAPVVRLCLSHHEALRSVALEVLQTMIVSEFVLNGEFSALQNEIINALDATFHHKPADADAMSKTLLVESLRLAFAVPGIDEELTSKVEELLNSVELFFELLVSAYGDSHEADVELEHILKLMEFVKGMNRRDIYLKYLHQLARRHENNGHYVEAGVAFKLEAELYKWDLHTQLEESVEPEHPPQTEFARKESLYNRIIECYDKGKAWEKATELCKELAEQYEKTLDYLSLKNILLRHASFLDLILTVDRPAPSYFRVHCWGQAWPLAQRNKDWIVQGADWEKISSFSERMQLLYPTAQLVNATTMPSFEAMDKGQYLQVTALVPIPDRENPVFTTLGVSPRIRQYHEHHFVNHFSYQIVKRNTIASRENPDPNSESVADLWTERRILSSEASFPNIARKANVVNYATVRSSPIENAIQAVKAKNDELLELEKKFEPLSYEEKEEVNANSLSLALTGVIDSPLNGGIHKYREAFLGESYIASQRGNKEAVKLVQRLKSAIEDQVVIVRRCLEIHQNLVSKEMKPFHRSLVELFHKNFSQELAVVRPPTPRLRPAPIDTKRDTIKISVDEPTPVANNRPTFIPPINITTAPEPVPASVQHPGSMSRTSSSSLHPHEEEFGRVSVDGGDQDSETPNTVRSGDRRSFTSRLTGASVKGLRKTLSFRGRKSGEAA